MALILKDATCVTPFHLARQRTVVIDGTTIRAVTSADCDAGGDDSVIELDGDYLLPGFIDLHAHGAVGGDFRDPDPPVTRMVSYFRQHGVTGVLATLTTGPMPQFLESVGRVAAGCAEAGGGLLGIHCEGPFLNPELCGGAPAEFFLEPTVERWRQMHDAGKGWIKLMTLSPELEGAMTVLRAARRDGTAVSAGHSNASYETAQLAVKNGLSLVTHVFNAMAPLHHREPGVLLAAMLCHELPVQLNAEGVHVHPLVMRMLYRLKGPAGIVLGSDSTRGAGLPDGTYEHGRRRLEVKGPIARFEDGTIVGATTSLDHALRVMVGKVGVPLTEAARMASLNPARVLGLDHRKGVIAPGKDADLVIMDQELRVKKTIMMGRLVYECA